MAENLKDTAGKGHNHGPLSNEDKILAIQNLDECLTPLEEEKDALNTKMKNLRKDFKKITGIVRADFDKARSMAAIEDEDEQEEKATNFQLCFNALAGGRQYNLFGEDPKPKKK